MTARIRSRDRITSGQENGHQRSGDGSGASPIDADPVVEEAIAAARRALDEDAERLGPDATPERRQRNEELAEIMIATWPALREGALYLKDR